MTKLKMYLDTSAIGYLDEHSSPKEMEEMQKLWELIKRGDFDVIISDVTMQEINNNKNTEKVETLLDYIAQIDYAFVETTDDAKEIAEIVKKHGYLVSKKCNDDRLHIGIAITNNCDIIVSMNFNHLTNIRTIKGVRGVSLQEGRKIIDIVEPKNIIYEEDD